MSGEASMIARIGLQIDGSQVTAFENLVTQTFAKIAAEARAAAAQGDSLAGTSSRFQGEQAAAASVIGASTGLPADTRQRLLAGVQGVGQSDLANTLRAAQTAIAGIAGYGAKFSPLSAAAVSGQADFARKAALSQDLAQRQQDRIDAINAAKAPANVIGSAVQGNEDAAERARILAGSTAYLESLVVARTAQNELNAAINRQLSIEETFLASEAEAATATAELAAARSHELAGSRAYLASQAAATLANDRLAAAQAVTTGAARASLFADDINVLAAQKTQAAEYETIAAQRIKLAQLGLAEQAGETTAQAGARIAAQERLVAADEALTADKARLAAIRAGSTSEAEEASLIAQRKVIDKQLNQELNRRVAAEIQAQVTAGTIPAGTRFQQYQVAANARAGNEPKLPTDYATVGQQLESKFATTASFALSGLVTYGLITSLKDVYTSEQDVQHAFTIIQGQLNGLNQGGSLGAVRSQIAGIAADTGVAEAQIAQVFPQIEGAFHNTATALADAKTAAEIARITGADIATLTQELTPTAASFGVSFRQITDEALLVQEKSGVQAQRTIELFSALGPVATQAGLKLRDVGGIAAAVLQDVSRSPASVAEDFNRLIPQLQATAAKTAPVLQGALGDSAAVAYAQAVGSGDTGKALELLTADYKKLNTEQQNNLFIALGSSRTTKDLIALILNQGTAAAVLGDQTNGAGKTTEYFTNLQKTLGQELAEIREKLLQVGRAILESGVAPAFQDGLHAVGFLLTALEKVAEVVVVINRDTHGLVTDLFEAVAAVKLLEVVGGKLAPLGGILTGKGSGSGASVPKEGSPAEFSAAVADASKQTVTAAQTAAESTTSAAETFATTVTDAATAAGAALSTEVESAAAVDAATKAETTATEAAAAGAAANALLESAAAVHEAALQLGLTDTEAAAQLVTAAATAAAELVTGAAAAAAELAGGGAAGGGLNAAGGVGAAAYGPALPETATATSAFLNPMFLIPAGLIFVGLQINAEATKIRAAADKLKASLSTASDAELQGLIQSDPSFKQTLFNRLKGTPTDQTVAASVLAGRQGTPADLQAIINAQLALPAAVTSGAAFRNLTKDQLGTGASTGGGGSILSNPADVLSHLFGGGPPKTAEQYLKDLEAKGTKELPDLLKGVSGGNKAAIQVANDVLNAYKNDPNLAPAMKTAVAALQAALSGKPAPGTPETAEQINTDLTANVQTALQAYQSGDVSLGGYLQAVQAQINFLNTVAGAGVSGADKQLATLETQKAKVLSTAAKNASDLAARLAGLRGQDTAAFDIQNAIDTLNNPALTNPSDRKAITDQLIAAIQKQADLTGKAVAIPAAAQEEIDTELAQGDAAWSVFLDQYDKDGTLLQQAVTLAVNQHISENAALLKVLQQNLQWWQDHGNQPEAQANIIQTQNAINALQGLPAIAGSPGSGVPSVQSQAQLQKAEQAYNAAQAGGDNVKIATEAIAADQTDEQAALDANDMVAYWQAKAQEAKDRQTLATAEADVAKAQAAYKAALAAGDDPIALAQAAIDQDNADIAAAQAAHDTVAVINAQTKKLQDERTLAKALQSLGIAQLELVKAHLVAAGDTVGASQEQVDIIKAEIANATADKAGPAALVDLNSQLVAAQAGARDARLQQGEDQISFQQQMGQITAAQAVALYEQLLTIPNLTQQEQQHIQLLIRGLLDSASNIQFNLPSDINLPTLYSARRLNDTPGGAGYSDNRQIEINLNVFNGADVNAAVGTIVDAVNAAPSYGSQGRIL